MEIRRLEREVTHWKANHATEVRRARILKERTDMPMERVAAYHQWQDDLAQLFRMTGEVSRLRKQLDDDANVCNVCDNGSMRPVPRFPVALRKAWSGSEVQKWLDEQFAK